MVFIDAAVLSTSGRNAPYAASAPLVWERLELASPRAGELRVKVHAACLCHSDLSVIDGSRPRPVPMVLGHEGSGVVTDVGDGVVDLEPGDHVVFSFVPACGSCRWCQSGRPALCVPAAAANGAGTLLGGGRRFSRRGGEAVSHHLGVSCFAEETVVSARSVISVDRSVDLAHAALFGCGMLTGVGAVVNTAKVPTGASVAIFGMGGVGMAAVIGAALAGANPIIAIDPLPEKHTTARLVGATHTLLPDDGVVEAVREITGGGAEYCFEAVGSAAVLATAYASTARGGTTVAVGLPHPSHRLEVPAVSVVAEERCIRGSYMGSSVPARDIPRMIGLHAAGRIPIDHLVSDRLRPDQINDGLDALATGQAVRQVIEFT